MTRRRWFAAAVVAAIAVTACAGSGDDDSGDSGDLSGADPGDCITVDMAVSSEKIALLDRAGRGVQRQRRRRARRGVRVRASLQQVIWRRRPTHRRGLAEPGGQRHPARDLVARRVRVGGHRQRTGRRRARPGRHPVHAHPARHRHAPADGRGPRVARHADRLRRHRRAGQRSRGLGVARPPGMGPVPTRQDQPELLHERAQLHHRRVLRGHRQVPRPDDRGSQSTRGDRVRGERRIGGRALRRHHDDVPQQLVRHRRSRHIAHLRLGGGGRREERHRLQPRQSRRCAGGR